MTPEQKDDLKKKAKLVVEAKGYNFHTQSFLEGMASAERFHGIKVPTCTTRDRSKKDDN